MIHFQREITDDLFKLILPDINTTDKTEFISQLEDEILNKMNSCTDDMKEKTEEEMNRRVKAAEDLADQRAQAMHRITQAREAELCERIAALKRQLKVGIMHSAWRLRCIAVVFNL